jgi:hypothetical protein
VFSFRLAFVLARSAFALVASIDFQNFQKRWAFTAAQAAVFDIAKMSAGIRMFPLLLALFQTGSAAVLVAGVYFQTQWSIFAAPAPEFSVALVPACIRVLSFFLALIPAGVAAILVAFFIHCS